jgi:hypothetical protein
MAKRFLGAAMVAACLALIAAPALDVAVFHVSAFAQTTVTSSAPSETTINVGQLLAPWLQILIAAVVSCILALFGWLTKVFNDRAGLQNNASVLAIEGQARDTLQSALTNAAGLLVMKLGPQLDGMKLDVKSPMIADAVNTVNKLAGDAVTRFGITPDTVGALIIAKVGVLTASNPSVTPSTGSGVAPLESSSTPAAAAAMKA